MFTLRRLQVGLLAGAVLVLAVPARAAEVDPYLPGDTEVVFVVNAKQLLDSSLVKKHFLQEMQAMIKSNAEVTNILNSLGFDPFKDLTSLTAAMSMVGNDAKGLLITHGNFDKAKFEAKAEEVAKDKSDILKVVREGDRKVYEIKHDPGEKPHYVGLANATTIVVSPDKQYVLDALAKGDGKKQPTVKKPVQDLIEKVDGKQSVWFTATANAFLRGDLSGDERAKKNLEKMDSITAGLTIDKGVKVDFAIVTKSATNAKELAEEIKEGLSQAKGLLALMSDQYKKITPLVDIVGKLQVNTQGSTISLASEVSEEIIEKGLKN
jgi:hypothetical protein